jgi:hypothetical protein
MADRAQVTSVEAIEAFRSSLILYLSKARPALEEVSGDVLRVRLWLQNDQRSRWQHELKVRARELERAQAELFGSRLSKIQTATAAQHMSVIRARRAVREAEAKLRLLKKWDRELENRASPLLKQVDNLHGYLTSHLARAVPYLAQMIKTLEAYGGDAPPRATPAGADGRSTATGFEDSARSAVEPGSPVPGDVASGGQA